MTLAQRRTDRLVEVFKLSVAVGVVRSLAGLAVCLKAVAASTQYRTDTGMTDAMTQITQGPSDLAQALDRPAKRLLRIPALRRCDDPLQILNQTRVGFFQQFAASPRPAHPTIRRSADLKLIQAAANGTAGNPGNSRHRGNPTPAGGQRFARRKNPPLPLVQIRAKRLEPSSYRRLIDHDSTYGTNRCGSTTTC